MDHLSLKSPSKLERKKELEKLQLEINTRSSISVADCSIILNNLLFEDSYDTCRELSFRIVWIVSIFYIGYYIINITKQEWDIGCNKILLFQSIQVSVFLFLYYSNIMQQKEETEAVRVYVSIMFFHDL